MKAAIIRASLATAAILVWGLTLLPAAAQSGAGGNAESGAHKLPNLPVKPTPRTTDGPPDFSGMWIEGYQISAAYFPAPYPYTAAAAAKVRELYKAGDTDPVLHCLPYGYPRNLGGAHPIQLVQTPGQ